MALQKENDEKMLKMKFELLELECKSLKNHLEIKEEREKASRKISAP